jgi:hypothetical protein
VVYQGLDIESGEFVAIKQVKLRNIPKDQLASIMVSFFFSYFNYQSKLNN